MITPHLSSRMILGRPNIHHLWAVLELVLKGMIISVYEILSQQQRTLTNKAISNRSRWPAQQLTLHVMQSGSTHNTPKQQHFGNSPDDTGMAGSPISSVQKQAVDQVGETKRFSAVSGGDLSQNAAKKQKTTQQVWSWVKTMSIWVLLHH